MATPALAEKPIDGLARSGLRLLRRLRRLPALRELRGSLIDDRTSSNRSWRRGCRSVAWLHLRKSTGYT
ncbi:hypothetical protein F2981_12460 [Sinorhizobium meliloti]|nr:hypothetical protein [Sinorhizobium meliloti]